MLESGAGKTVSIDHYRHELRAQMSRAAANGAVRIDIHGRDLCNTLRERNTAAFACIDAMRQEMKPGDVVLVEPGGGIDMTVRYLLPRDGG